MSSLTLKTYVVNSHAHHSCIKKQGKSSLGPGFPPFMIRINAIFRYSYVSWTTLFRIQGVPTNDMTPNKNCPGAQGNINWMLGYKDLG